MFEKKALQSDLDSLKSAHEHLAERYWELYRAHYALLSHLNLTEEKVPPKIKIVPLK